MCPVRLCAMSSSGRLGRVGRNGPCAACSSRLKAYSSAGPVTWACVSMIMRLPPTVEDYSLASMVHETEQRLGHYGKDPTPTLPVRGERGPVTDKSGESNPLSAHGEGWGSVLPLRAHRVLIIDY